MRRSMSPKAGYPPLLGCVVGVYEDGVVAVVGVAAVEELWDVVPPE